jgi:DNA-binding response OmpR family regulator
VKAYKKKSRNGVSAKTARHSQTIQPKRILLVEDSPDLSLLGSEALRGAGYQLDTTPDGLLALHKLKTDHYDLAIIEDELPTVAGRELVKALRSEFIMIPAILVMGSVQRDKSDPNTWPQVQAILFKPYTVLELLITVKQVLSATSTDAGLRFAPPSNWQSPICSRWISGSAELGL